MGEARGAPGQQKPRQEYGGRNVMKVAEAATGCSVTPKGPLGSVHWWLGEPELVSAAGGIRGRKGFPPLRLAKNLKERAVVATTGAGNIRVRRTRPPGCRNMYGPLVK